MKKVNIGIIGCGNISPIYFEAGQKFDILNIVACADLDLEKAQEMAKRYNVPKACSVDDILADLEVEIIINLTIPAAHADIHRKALEAGKHSYGEKPLAIEVDDAKSLIRLAEEKGLRLGSAPDTFLGGGLQTARKLIDDGWIGAPIAATAFMTHEGPEIFHPGPDFLYQYGAGPMFDMGPYYLTALIHLIGSIQRVTGSTATPVKERMVKNGPDYGRTFPVETPTHIAGVLDFENGAVATLVTSFDVKGSKHPFHIEIHGTDGSMVVPDPNTFDGPVYVKKSHHKAFIEVPLTHGFTENSRGLGVLDMAYAIQNEREHRATGKLALHVLEAIHGFHIASNNEKHYHMTTKVEKPTAFPLDQPVNGLKG
ncbi:Gfo/Idh/MocA family oxidoreductase [Bacillaceae bacterium SIJ1]|uniref:Gfo/Idh/MocA family protein n=1 Tax=Litoribacterium kuwaitense TaxID=1398745 RepID=UPI0013ED86BF|nr:Gfo/Idh/MocA family oxidoreductase [Litoribacterium kuwaitense]NGP45238.1 Gfo/Idh/MocA family oxidoreductase [Litoribacterium kuwaitense]